MDKDRIELRAQTDAINSLCLIMLQVRTMVAETNALLKQPPSKELEELLTRMALAIESNTAAIRSLQDAIRK